MVFTMPWCPACAILTAPFCSASGSTIRCPLRMMLSSCASDSSARLACRVWNVALFMPFVGKDGLNDGSECPVFCRFRCNFINCHCFGG